jgi:NitT/TauT family transport system substrate-binding protein
MRLSLSIAAALMALALPASAQKLTTVTLGVVPSIPAGATWIAIEKGYFREAGIEVQLEKIESAAPAMSMLAAGRLQVVEGGLAAGYWNALQQNLPVIMALERGSSPLYHDVLVRNDLADQIKTVKDLKGRTVALVAPGSAVIYEMGKILATAGLTIKDIEIKYIPFPQMGVALTNKAVDAALEVPPFGAVAIAQKLGTKWIDPDDYVKPQPISFITYLANTDWIKKEPELSKKLFTALVRGGRDYCQAYHHGPNRQEVEEIMWKYRAVADRELISTMQWQARDPNGRFNPESILDMQEFFAKEGLIGQKFPIERLIDTSYSEAAAKSLPPFQVINKESKLAGCR